MPKFRLLLILVSLLPAGLASAQVIVWDDKLEKGDTPVAIVNGEKITRQDVLAVMLRRYARQTAAEMIQRLLVEQEAKKAGVTVTDKEIDARFEDVRQGIIEEARRKAVARGEDPKKLDEKLIFSEWVYQTYLGPEEFRVQLRTNLLAESIVAQTIEVKDEDLLGVKGRVITISFAKHTEEEAMKRAEEARKKAASTPDFGAVAKKYSEDEFAKQGGDVPEFRVGSVYLPVEPTVAATLASLKPGEVSPVVKGKYGCFVAKLDRLESAADMDIFKREEVRKKLVDEQKQSKLQSWLADVKRRAKVEFVDKRYESSIGH